MKKGQTIEMFFVDGTADGLVFAELLGWNGKAIKISRKQLKECKREEFQAVGVYFLFGRNEDDEPFVYIGEAENLRERLMQHYRNKELWTTVVAFIGDDLNKAFVRFLEDRLTKLARDAKRYKVETQNTYSKTKIKESHEIAMEDFIEKIEILLPALGYDVLTPLVSNEERNKGLLYLKKGNVNATAKITEEGFVVYAGAKMNEKMNTKSTRTGPRLRERYKALVNSDFSTKEDILFSSSSAAADFLLGYSVSGPASWVNKDGKTIKELDL